MAMKLIKMIRVSIHNRCCMCRCNGESVDHLLFHCVICSLWVQVFGIQWVMPGSVVGLLFCWNHSLGIHTSDTWNLIPGYLMWIVWMKRNRHSFKDTENTLEELKDLCQRSLFDWSQCWGFTNCSLLPKFVFS